MWKKIQTLYLGISTLLIISMYFLRFAEVSEADGSIASIHYYEKTSYLILLILLTLTHVGALLCFKYGQMQARLSSLSALICIGFLIVMGMDFFEYKDSMVFSPTMLFPLAAAFLDFLTAHRSLVDVVTIQTARKNPKMFKKAQRKS